MPDRDPGCILRLPGTLQSYAGVCCSMPQGAILPEFRRLFRAECNSLVNCALDRCIRQIRIFQEKVLDKHCRIFPGLSDSYLEFDRELTRLGHLKGKSSYLN